ncbi:hypothetical protein CL654_02610 [bacterium]|nr:hypothetical protein [bacterium]|tara:strand:- start:14562 stop:15776 length:1215 start_codon:yes stop_codon:yes gene_type:complete
MKELSRRTLIVLIVLAILIGAGAFSFGVTWGYAKRIHADTISQVFGERAVQAPDIDLTPLWEAWDLIDEKYVFPDKPDNQTRLLGAISGLVGSVPDPYTGFLPPEEASVFEEDINGNFGGVGIEISTRGGVLTVVAPLKGSPGESAGLQPGDAIIEVDGETTSGLNVDQAASRIRGEIGTNVTLTVFREAEDIAEIGETFEVTITRGNIEIPTINFYQSGEAYVVELYNFGAQSPTLFEGALNDFKKSGLDNLLIDLRGNPGGFLEASIEMASLFLSEGKVIVREDMGEGREEVVHRSKGYDFFDRTPEIIILVDGGSASASEILAAALQEHGLATVVGERTFGKGSVQELVPLTRDTFVKITIARWLTPDGRSIEENGVKIDVPIEREDDGSIQLQKALDLFN